MTTLDKNTVAPPPKDNLRGLVICQILGLAALALIVLPAADGSYRPLRYALLVFAAFAVIVKPNWTLYVFIASLFTIYGVIESGSMFAVIIADFVFAAFVLAFVGCTKIDFKAVLIKQRSLFTLLALFMLWAALGFIINFYSHEPIANIASAFHVFNIAQLVIIVVILCQPQWERHWKKVIFFFLICALFEIAGSLTSRILSEKFSTAGFRGLTSTLGTPHHGSMGNAMTLSVGIAAGACFIFKERYQKFFAGFAGAASMGVLILSGSRSSMMGLVLALPITVLLGYRLKVKTLFIVLVSVGAALTIFWLSPLRAVVTGFQSSNIDPSAYGRFLIWERVYDHALHGPWMERIFGIGIGTFNTLRFDYFLEAGTFTTGGHNNFLHAFVETGVVGLILFLAIFGEIIRRLTIRSRNGGNSAKCFLYCTLALLVSCLTQETFWFSTSFGRFWLQYMFLYLLITNFDNSTDEPRGLLPRATSQTP